MARKKSAGRTKTYAPRKKKVRTRIDVFVDEYAIHLSGTKAAIAAGYAPDWARQTACDLLARSDVQAKVNAALEERSERTKIVADDVLRMWMARATADPRELTEMRRCCCRYCYGKGNRYQRTPRELAEFRQAFDNDVHEKAAFKGMPVEQYVEEFGREFDDEGGLGWDPRKDPHPNCPECHGQGVETPFYKDTRDLSPEAKLLFAGVKTTQHGVEIKTYSQEDALTKVAQHLGMLKQRVVHANDKDNPMPASVGVVMIPPKATPDESGG